MHAKTNHTSARVSDDISSPTRVSDDVGSPALVSDDISGLIRLWHVSSIRLRPVSLTHPQTPINRSLPKAFQKIKTSWDRPRHLGRGLGRYLEFRSPEALLEPSPEASRNFKNFNFEYKEHSKRNHLNYLPRSQRSLKSSSKASRNLNKSQISETLQIQASKAPKNFHHKPSNTKNIRSRIIQTTCLDLKVHWNQAQKPPETSTNHKLVKLYRFKPLKHQRTSTTNPQKEEKRTKNTKNTRRTWRTKNF